MGRVLLQFFSKIENEIIHSAGGRHGIVIPNFIEQIVAVDGLSFIFCKVFQYGKFFARQLYFLKGS